MSQFHKPKMGLSLFSLCAWCLASITNVSGQERLLNYIPRDANFAILLDVQKPDNPADNPNGLGDNGINSQFLQHVEHVPFFIPSSLGNVVLAAEIDWDTLNADWEIGVAQLDRNNADLVEFDGQIIDKPCCKKNGIQFVRLTLNTIGLMWPPNRQKVSRWINETENRDRPTVSNYLIKALSQRANGEKDLLFGVEFADAFDPKTLELFFENSPTAIKQGIDPGELALLFAGLQGLRGEIELGPSATGKISLDFSDEIGKLENAVSIPLLTELFAMAGFDSIDLEDWKMTQEDRVVTLQGTMPHQTLRRVNNLLNIDPAMFSSLRSHSRGAESVAANYEKYEKIIANREVSYFVDHVRQTVLDLDSGWVRNSTLPQFSYFVARAAQKIQRLPRDRVSEEMATITDQISEKLFVISDEIRIAVAEAITEVQSNVNSVEYGAYPYRAITTASGRYFSYAPTAYWSVDLGSYPRAKEKVAKARVSIATKYRELGPLLKELERLAGKYHHR